MSNLLEHNQSVIANIISLTKGLPTSTCLATKDDKIFEAMSGSEGKSAWKLLMCEEATSVLAADYGNIDADMDLSMKDREKLAEKKQRKKKTKINRLKVYYNSEGSMCEHCLI